MCDQTEVNYREGDIVWVKLGSYFWPGEVQDVDKLDEEILVSFKKKPIAAVKFFDEDKYEYVKNLNQICFYNCRKKHEYIKKGLDMYRRQKEGSYMDKFPDDVRKAEIRTGGNPDILADSQFQPQEKPNYRGLFGSDKKGKHVSPKQSPEASTNGRKSQSATPVRNPPRLITITHPRFIKGETEHKIHIRQQPATSPETGKSSTSPSSPAAYKCQQCDFTSNRLNVIVLHNKFHSANTQTSTNNAKGKGTTSKSKSSSVKVRPVTASPEPKSKSKPKSPIKEPDTHSRIAPDMGAASQEVSPPKLSAVKRKILDVSIKDTEDIEAKKVLLPVPESPENKKSKDASPESPEKRKPKAVSSETSEKKILKTPEKVQDVTKPSLLGKRKSSKGDDKALKKIKSDEEIREKLLADWDDEDAEQEEKEMELLKQKLKGDNATASDSSDTQPATKGDHNKAVSCFDFDDSKDAILDNELEERAKKFVENRKVPRVIDEKADQVNIKQLLNSPATPETSSNPDNKTESPACADDFSEAISTLLAETEVPKLPEIPITSSEPCKNSSILPDVVLDSNLAANSENKTEVVEVITSMDFQGGDHDYSAKQKGKEAVPEISPLVDDDILDINSMPVVMADAVITDEPSTSQMPVVSIQMPKIDLIPNPNVTNSHTIIMTDGRLAMSPSVQSVVKAVRGSSADRSKVAAKTVVSVPQVSGNTRVSNVSTLQNAEKLTPAKGARLLQQGIASGKYVIIPPPGTAPTRLTTKPSTSTTQPVPSIKSVAGTAQQQVTPSGKLLIITKPQQQVLTALTPAQQKALVAGGKLPSPQRLLTSTGQLLTPVNPRNIMAKGTKLTQVAGQQIRTLTSGKQTGGPKVQMQSVQTKIILPTMETVKVPQTQPQQIVRMVTTGKTQSNTILIQATQSNSMLSSIVSKVSTASTPLLPKLTVQPKQRPRLLTSLTMPQHTSGKPAMILPASPKVQQTRQAFQPRMLLQKSRPVLLANAKGEVPKVSPQSQASHASTAQPVQNVIQMKQPPLGNKSRVTTVRKTVVLPAPSPSIPSTKRVEAIPPLAPMQLPPTSADELVSLSQVPSMSLPSFHSNISEQIVTTSATTLGDNAAPTYMLLTIDEAGNLQPYTSQSLISYDGGSDQAGQTIYIDGLESGGDLDNIILTIGNSSSLALDVGQTNTMTNVSSIYNTRAPSSSQDILAAALANTDVFQSEVALQDTLTVVSSNRSSVMTPCVVESSVMLTSPPSSLLLPSLNRAADVSETSLTLNQPIMTPLEVPSSVVPTRAPAPISFPMELPLTATQTLNVPMPSYTIVNESVPSTESIFQPSMPLLSEEMLTENHTTSSSELSHSRITYDTSQEHPELGSYTDTIQIIQHENLPESKLYQSHLASQTSSDSASCTEQTESFTTSLREESHYPPSTALSDEPLVIAEKTLVAEVPNDSGPTISNSATPASNLLDTPMEVHTMAGSLPSVLATNAPISCQTSVLPQKVETEHLPVFHESCSSHLSEFLPPQTKSNVSQHSFRTTVPTAAGLDPSTGVLESDNSKDDMKITENLNDGITHAVTVPKHVDTTAVFPIQTEIDSTSCVSTSNQAHHSEINLMRSNTLANMLDLPSNHSQRTDSIGGDASSTPIPQSMPLLAEQNNVANVEKQLCENVNLENSLKDSPCCMDSSPSEMKFGDTAR